jgi:hypothetical protein
MRFLFLSSLFLLTARVVFAGELHPELEAYISTLPDEATVSVIIHLKDQVDVQSLDFELKKEHATRTVRHERMVRALKEVAIRTQSSLIDHLERAKAKKEVIGYSAHWISNLIIVLAAKGEILDLLDHPDVDFIEPNFKFTPIESVSPEVGSVLALPGIAHGIRAINADLVWHELGITGSGRIVATLDTGVDGSHPALASRWRGMEPGVDPSEAWLDLVHGGSEFPEDPRLGHGTHVMGTLTGLDPASGDTIGVTPGAQWIACNAVDQATGPDFDNDIITAFEWFIDPDGDPQTIEDVPDVVENSWGVYEYFWSDPPYTDCDSRWWSVMDNCEAAGVVLVFSAGNNGPASESLASPANRATTPYNSFSVGAVNATNYDYPYPIWENSSRGPSACDHISIKPEVCAPGVKVYSSVRGGGYELWTGTSHAGPHAAGVVALIREVRPNLEVDEIKDILMATAHDFGTQGEDNTYGMGFIDAYEAVLMSMEPISIYVPDDYTTIQEAIMSSVNGDTIIVGPGTYTENIDFQGKAIIVMSGQGPDVTIIDGNQAGSVVTFQSDEDSTSVLDGFTLTNGAAGNGGGIYCVDSSPTISGNIITNNEATDGMGGGILCVGITTPCFAAPILTRNTIVNNMAVSGGGIYCDFSCAPRLENNAIKGNSADSGGGIYCNDDATMINNTITENTADSGGGLYCSDAVVSVINTIFRDNSASVGPEISVNDSSYTTISYTDVEGGQSSVYIDDGCILDWGEGMIDTDPLFRNAANDDFHLMAVACGDSSDSPCIDAGDPTIEDLILDCYHGLGTVRSDMGAYGGRGEGPPVSIQGEGKDPDVVSLPRAFLLSQNYPNPFNPSTTIAFDIPGSAGTKQMVSLTIYDIRGRRVQTLIDSDLTAGSHKIHWNGRNDRGQSVPSGIYLYTLKAGGEVYTRKMTVLK